MKWSIDYNNCANAEEAYEKVKKSITAELISKFKVKADIDYTDLDKIFEAKGKGFNLKACFGEKQVDVDLSLSMFLKPVGKKVKEVLHKEMTKVV